MLSQLGRHSDALGNARQALELQQDLCDGVGYANALNTVGWCYALVGNYQQTLTYCQQAIASHEEISDRDGEAATWDTLGYAHHHLGDHRQAAACYRRAICLFRDLGDQYYEAVSLINLGDTHDVVGDHGAPTAPGSRPRTSSSDWDTPPSNRSMPSFPATAPPCRQPPHDEPMRLSASKPLNRQSHDRLTRPTVFAESVWAVCGSGLRVLCPRPESNRRPSV